ncbi:MAG: ChaN family lipoprotein [bacterium]
MKRPLGLLWICISFPAIWGCATLPSSYTRLDDQITLPLNGVLAVIEQERVIFVGEGHTSTSDHLFQMEVIKHLKGKGKNVAVALEMFPARMQQALDQWVDGSLDEDDFVDAYYSFWSVDYDSYGMIFNYARQEGIPLFGINADRNLIATVARRGLGGVDKEFLEKIRYTHCFEDPEYSAFLKGSEELRGHDSELPNLCSAQRLRDAIMAYDIARIFNARDGSVVVLLGAAHAAKVAVPRMLEKNFSIHSLVLLPGNFGGVTEKGPDSGIADYLWY